MNSTLLIKLLENIDYRILGKLNLSCETDIVFASLRGLISFRTKLLRYFELNNIDYKLEFFNTRIYQEEIKLHIFKKGILQYQLDLWIVVQRRGFILYKLSKDYDLVKGIKYAKKKDYNYYKQCKSNIPIYKYFINLNNFFRLFKLLFLRYFKNRVFVFYGTDGVGKTTQIDMLSKKILNKTIIIHTNPKIFSLNKIRLNKKIASPIRNKYPLNFIKANLYVIYILIDHIIFTFYQKFTPFKIIIYDRFFLDLLIQDRYKNCNKLLIKSLYKFFFSIDFGFVFHADSNNIFSRKNELSIEEITNQNRKYLKLLNFPNLFKIEVNKTIKEVHFSIIEIIFKCKVDGK